MKIIRMETLIINLLIIIVKMVKIIMLLLLIMHKLLNKKLIELIVIHWFLKIKLLQRKNQINKMTRVVWGVGEYSIKKKNKKNNNYKNN
jgi:hypothetical protein